MKLSEFTIWVDADACPKLVKETLFKVSSSRKIKIVFVANSYLTLPLSPYLEFIKVEKGSDIADLYIAKHMDPQDIVITQDIPLAAQIVESGALAINPRGEIYTEENISERLSLRDFSQELRDSGIITSGPTSFNQKDKISFTNALDRIITKKLST